MKLLPHLGRYQEISPEAVLALHPTLVLAWQGGDDPGLLATLKQLGLRVVVLHNRTIPDIATMMRQLGKLTGYEQQANKQARLFLQRYHALKQQASTHPVRVF